LQRVVGALGRLIDRKPKADDIASRGHGSNAKAVIEQRLHWPFWWHSGADSKAILVIAT
jgi:hypothetical protein